MNINIALLRGINVSGQKIIKMADLRTLLEKEGLLDVQTYIQSGNIVFKSEETRTEKLALIIETCIKNAYDFDVPVTIISPTELVTIKEQNLYLKDDTKENSKIYFTFLYAIPTSENAGKLLSYQFKDEEFYLGPKILYSYSKNGAGRAKLTNKLIENKLKVTASSRNYNTVLKLIEMSTS